MRRIIVIILSLLTLAASLHAQEDTPSGPFVLVCPIQDEIGPGTAIVVRRAIREAEGASLIVFVVDTPGGRLDSAIEITRAILAAPCPTVAYLEGMGAISAGALISYSCDYIVVGPAVSIGASTPFVPGVEMSEDVTEKTYSYLRSKYRALGEEKGHNVFLGEAMVDPEIALHSREDDDGKLHIYKVHKVDGEQNIEQTVGERPTVSEDLLDKIFRAIEEGQGIPMEGIERKVRKAFGKPAPAPEETEDSEEVTAAKSEGGQPLPEGTKLICKTDELLTLTAMEAVHYGLALDSVRDLDGALGLFGAEEMRRVTIMPNWAEGLYAWLTSPLISGLLLMCAMGGIYLEVRTPGFGLPGVIGICCLAVFLGAQYVVGLAEWEDLMLIVIGLSLLIIEIFVLPGFGIVGAAGLLALLAGLYLSMVRVPIPEYPWDFQNLQNATYTLIVAMATLMFFIVVTWKFMPKNFVFRWLLLSTSQETAEGYVVQTRDDVQAAVGKRGIAKTMLRPAGRGRFGNKTYDVVTRGEFIEAGSVIEIIQAEGNRYVVAARPAGEDRT